MSNVRLLPGLEHLAAQGPTAPPRAPLSVPRTRVRYVGDVQLIDTPEAAREAVSCLLQQRIGWVGLDTEYVSPQESRDPLAVNLRTVQLAPAIPCDGGLEIWRGLVFLVGERPEVREPLAKLLRQPWRFVAHYARAEIESLTAAGLPIPTNIFDTHLAIRLCTLGHPDWHDFLNPNLQIIGEYDIIEAHTAAKEVQAKELSLLGLCSRFGVVHRFADRKDEMQMRFADGQPLDSEMVAYAAEDARVAASLYLPVVQQLSAQGLLGHFEQIELPALPVFIGIGLQGITVDSSRLERVRVAAEQATKHYADELRSRAATLGAVFDKPRSPLQRLDLMRVLGLDHLFLSGKTTGGKDKHSFERDRFLKRHRDRHPAIEALYRYSLLSKVPSDKLFQGVFTGPRDRVHSRIEALGAHTGRPSFSEPNLASVSRIFRPAFVVDGPEHEIVEIDFKAEEPGISAAHYRDDKMLAAWNGEGDFYTQMGRDLGLNIERPALKVLTLATLYGQTPRSTAEALAMEEYQARNLLRRVFDRYPVLAAGMKEAEDVAQVRGYAETRTGLKRYLDPAHKRHVRNRRVRNLPVQGGGADILKILLPRVDNYLRRVGGRILVPLYDSLVFQAPRETRVEATRIVDHEMVMAMQMIYPELVPKLDVNDRDTSCWNKDGQGGSIDRFERDATFDIR